RRPARNGVAFRARHHAYRHPSWRNDEGLLMRKLFSVDDHIIEPADSWSSRVEAKYRARAPHIVREDDRQIWVYEDTRNITVGLNATAGRPPEDWDLEPLSFADMLPGCYDPVARAKDLAQ